IAILAALKRHDILATFYCVGSNVLRYPDLMRQIVDDGHEVGNHSLTHPDLYRLSPSRVRNEVVACQQILQSFSTPVTFRAPYGHFRWDLRKATQFGISWLVKADVRPAWNCCDPALLSEEILRCTAPGSIILLHDGLFGCDEALSRSVGLAAA